MSLNFTSNLNFSTINIRRYNSFSMIKNVKYHNNIVTWPQAIRISFLLPHVTEVNAKINMFYLKPISQVSDYMIKSWNYRRRKSI